jgi:PncC family amidohydrolase
MTIEVEIGQLCRQKNLTLAIVESATGGLISHKITSVAGSSIYFKGSVIAYSNEAKEDIVGVRHDSLLRYGAVSSEIAEELAIGGRKMFKTDIAVSTTGIAGPGGATELKPIGLFYFGLAGSKGVISRRIEFGGTRLGNIDKATNAILRWVREYLVTFE